jgi:2-oxoglutarate dehydrogenase E1 component
LQGANATYVEWLYEQYLAEPASVPPEWRQYFSTLAAPSAEIPHGPIVQAVGERTRQRGAAPPASAAGEGAPAMEKQAAVSRLIQVYSLRGHQIADLDPLGLWERPAPAVLSFDFLGLDESDLQREFSTGGLAGTGHTRMKLQDILALLKQIYCGKLAAEFAHISRARERLWLREQFEACRVHWTFGTDEQKTILDSLTRAEGIERYLNTRFVGQKRFSLEGSETLIPALDDLIQRAGEAGVQELVIGMAHRGRLNVLVNVLGKSPSDLFSEFEGAYDLARLKGSGDVKYHKGYSADVRTPGGNVHIALAFNPSHLEIVNPVVEGSASKCCRSSFTATRLLPAKASLRRRSSYRRRARSTRAARFTSSSTIRSVSR